MKFILIMALLFTSSCASSPVVETEHCDAIANREQEFVCGKDRVRKKCSRVVDMPDASVCEAL